MQNWHMIHLILFACHLFSSYIFWGWFPFYIMIFFNTTLSKSWFCILPNGQIDGYWFDHQRLWLLLMVSIPQNPSTPIYLNTHSPITCLRGIQSAHQTTHPDTMYLTKAHWGWHPHQLISPSTRQPTSLVQCHLIYVHIYRPDSV